MEIEKESEKSSRVSRVSFKPLSEGLGINHFADGLPYAPHNQRKKSLTRFNYPPQTPRVQTEAEVEPVVETTIVEESTHYAGFLRRMTAFALDVAIVAAIFFLVVWASFSLNGLELKSALVDQRGFQTFWLFLMLYAVVHVGYFLIQEISWKTTMGKALLGMQINSKSGFATVGRAICFFIAAIPFGIGLFWYFFDSKKRCWHDVITDTEVISA